MATSTIFRRPNLVEVTDWAEGLTFSRYKLYQYNGILYRCLVTHVAGPSFDGSKFEALSGIEEANVDGKQYARKDGAWSEVLIPSASSVSYDMAVGANGVTAGNVVELVSDGVQDLQNIYHCEAPTIGSLVTLNGTNNIAHLSLVSLTSNTCFLSHDFGTSIYRGILTAGNPPTFAATSNAAFTWPNHASLSATAVAEVVYNATSANTETAILIVSGTNITRSTSAVLFSGATVGAATQKVCALTSSNWFVAYADGSSDAYIKSFTSNGSNAPSGSSSVLFNGGPIANYLSLCRMTDTEAMFVCLENSKGQMSKVTVSGTNAPVTSTLANLDGTNNCTYITQSPIDSNHTLCAYNNATTSNGCLAVIQANGTNAPTVISRAVFVNETVDFTSITANSVNTHTLFYRNSGGIGQSGMKVIHIDSAYSITISAQLARSGVYNAIAALTSTTAIAAFQGSGSDGFAGTLTLTPTPIISGQLLGISQDTATNGTATIDLGPVWETTNTLTLGEEYFANPAGGLTTNATPVFVGTADTTGSLVLDLKGNPSAGKQLSGEITVPGAFTWTVPQTGTYELTLVGAGGSGAQSAAAPYFAGNGGNTVIVIERLSANTAISGTIGAGGAAKSGGNVSGNDGGSTSMTLFSTTLTANGGRGGRSTSTGPTGEDSGFNRANSPGFKNLLGIPGQSLTGGHVDGNLFISGYPQMISCTVPTQTSVNAAAAPASSRGVGGLGSGNTYASGAGGDGLFSWRLVIGS